MNTARYRLGSNGTQTSALAYGGTTNFATGTNTNATEEYNGSAWTSKNNLNTTRSGLGGAGASSSSAIAFGGDNPGPSITTATELWNGTTWTSNPTGLATGRFLYGSCGTKTLALISGGQASTGITTSTEEWTDPSFATKTITVS